MKQKALLIAVISALIVLGATPALATSCAVNREKAGQLNWRIAHLMSRRKVNKFYKQKVVKVLPKPASVAPVSPVISVAPVTPVFVGEISASQIIAETNLQRQKAGLAPLSPNAKLNQAALAKAQDMLQKQYFAHVSPDGIGLRELMQSAGYEYRAVAENLAYGNFQNATAIVQGWMNSPGHRANMLGNFTEIGVAVIKGTFNGRVVYMAVQEFGTPR